MRLLSSPDVAGGAQERSGPAHLNSETTWPSDARIVLIPNRLRSSNSHAFFLDGPPGNWQSTTGRASGYARSTATAKTASLPTRFRAIFAPRRLAERLRFAHRIIQLPKISARRPKQPTLARARARAIARSGLV